MEFIGVAYAYTISPLKKKPKYYGPYINVWMYGSVEIMCNEESQFILTFSR
jgi:hypothetical protein